MEGVIVAGGGQCIVVSANDGRECYEVLGPCVVVGSVVEMRGAVKHVLVCRADGQACIGGEGTGVVSEVVRRVHRVCPAVQVCGGGTCAMAAASVSNWRVVRRKLWRQAGSWIAVGCCGGVLASSLGSLRRSRCHPGGMEMSRIPGWLCVRRRLRCILVLCGTVGDSGRKRRVTEVGSVRRPWVEVE